LDNYAYRGVYAVSVIMTGSSRYHMILPSIIHSSVITNHNRPRQPVHRKQVYTLR